MSDALAKYGIRITEENMKDVGFSSFSDFIRQEFQNLAKDIMMREEAQLIRDIRYLKGQQWLMRSEWDCEYDPDYEVDIGF